ncbi:MAG TPA: thioredoxin family protein [bacterium]|jgi:thiol-disulfide isomerase/thioredoxin|nr:thioredoxin family protein [bacterium]
MTLATHESIVSFSLPGTDGKAYSPDSFAGVSALAVIFWCNHCPYVRAWEDRVIALQREYAERGVHFVLINSNDPAKYPEDSFDKMTLRAREKGYPFPYLFDESQTVARGYGATRTPEIFLFDRDRELAYHGAPDDNYDDPAAVAHRYFRDALEAVVAGRTPAPAETPARGCTIKWR